MASPLSEAEQEQLQSLIARVPEGFLPLSMFLEIARLVVLPVIELVCFKYDEDRKKVLLLERAASDTLWPGQVHSPFDKLPDNLMSSQTDFLNEVGNLI
jgi:hypothetical protein